MLSICGAAHRNFGKWVGVELSAANHKQLWIPPGFGHGFLVLSESADVLYKATDHYAPDHDRSLRWDDPRLGIDWPLDGVKPILSAKDAGRTAARRRGCLRLSDRNNGLRSGSVRTYLVTGGAGFIGSNFIRYVLGAEPDAQVMNLDALTYAGVKATVDELDRSDATRSCMATSVTRRW